MSTASMFKKVSTISVLSSTMLKQLNKSKVGFSNNFSTAPLSRRSRLFTDTYANKLHSTLYQSKSQLYISSPDSTANATNDEQGTSTGGAAKRLETNFLARQFIQSLTPSERVVIKQELVKYEQEQALLAQTMSTKNDIKKPTAKQLLTRKF
jgi:hypothetical protein